MPIYEYKCSKCGEVFEAFQKISDNPLTRCKFCRGKVEQLISQSSFQLKGGGWYLTDYARKSSEGSSDTATKGKDKADASGKTGSKAESSAAKTEKAASS